LDAAPSFGGSYRGHGRLRGWPVDGVLMWAHPHQTLADFVGSSTASVVYLGGQRRLDKSDAVVFDLAAGARLLIQHVLERGYTRIAHVTPYHVMSNDEGEERLQTYRKACASAGVKFEVVTPDPMGETREAAWQVATQIVERPAAQRPQVLLCHNDVMAVGLYHGLRRAGLRVPEDVAVAGYDGIEEGRFLDRALSTVRLPVEEMSRAAVTMLLEKIAGGTASRKVRQIVIKPQLVVGETL
jgi:DNA-binding LacI/PurR family transcriptional regulator